MSMCAFTTNRIICHMVVFKGRILTLRAIDGNKISKQIDTLKLWIVFNTLRTIKQK